MDRITFEDYKRNECKDSESECMSDIIRRSQRNKVLTIKSLCNKATIQKCLICFGEKSPRPP